MPSCQNPPEKVGLSEAQKKSIQDLHNKYRQQIKNGEIKGLPMPKEMPMMEWDEKLEKEAERWATLCPDHQLGVGKNT